MAENGKLFIGDANIYEVDIKTKKIKMIIERCRRCRWLGKKQ